MNYCLELTIVTIDDYVMIQKESERLEFELQKGLKKC